MKKTLKILLIGLCLCGLCGCTPGTEPLKDNIESEVSHNEGAGYTAKPNPNEPATTDPAFFEKNGDQKTADKVKEETANGTKKVEYIYPQKDAEAAAAHKRIKNEYNDRVANADTNIQKKQKDAENRLKDFADQE